MMIQKILGCMLLFLAFGHVAVGQSDDASDSARQKELLDNLFYNSLFSDSSEIRISAFDAMAKKPDIFNDLKEGNRLEVIKTALHDPVPRIQGIGAQLLSNAILADDEKESLLIWAAFESKDATVNSIATQFLTRNKRKYVTMFAERIMADPLGDHDKIIRLLEQWRTDSAPAVDALVARFRALKQSAEKSEEANLRPDYLNVLITLAEIGPPAVTAAEVGIEALKEQSLPQPRQEYVIAGLIFFERTYQKKSNDEIAFSNERALLATKKFLQQFDKNGDDCLTQEEKDLTSGFFRTADTDNDQKVTKEELYKVYVNVYSQSAVVRSRSGRREPTVRSRLKLKK
ncbi:MAG: hypothetical protein AAF939_19500 [Planctomycetota bacterium]